MKAQKGNNEFDYLTSDSEFEIDMPEIDMPKFEIDMPEIEPIKGKLVWQYPEFWQEQHLNNGGTTEKNLHSKRERSKKNLNLNAERTPRKSKSKP